MRYIKKCEKCSYYSLKDICPCCSSKTRLVKVPNVGLEDPYQKYRVINKLKSDKRWDLIKLLS